MYLTPIAGDANADKGNQTAPPSLVQGYKKLDGMYCRNPSRPTMYRLCL